MSADATRVSISGLGTPIVATCSTGGCPTVYQPETGDDLIIQGYSLPDPIDIPAGEAVIVVPKQLIWEAAKRLSG